VVVQYMKRVANRLDTEQGRTMKVGRISKLYGIALNVRSTKG